MSLLNWFRALFARPQRPAADPLAHLRSAPTDQIRVLVGLGNPGDKYANTRHNVGFMLLDLLVQRDGVSWHRLSDQSEVALTQHEGHPLLLVKPQTFMNLSGTATQEIAEALGLPSTQFLIAYDDMDLPMGALRLRERGSGGTHNGMKHVVKVLATQDVPRLRIGIGAHGKGAIDHVLGVFSPEEQDELATILDRSASAALTWAAEGATAAQNRFNS